MRVQVPFFAPNDMFLHIVFYSGLKYALLVFKFISIYAVPAFPFSCSIIVFKCKNNSIVKLKDYTLYFSPDAEKELRIYVFGEKIEKNKYLLEIKMLNYLGGKQYFNAIIVKEKI